MSRRRNVVKASSRTASTRSAGFHAGSDGPGVIAAPARALKAIATSIEKGPLADYKHAQDMDAKDKKATPYYVTVQIKALTARGYKSDFDPDEAFRPRPTRGALADGEQRPLALGRKARQRAHAIGAGAQDGLHAGLHLHLHADGPSANCRGPAGHLGPRGGRALRALRTGPLIGSLLTSLPWC